MLICSAHPMVLEAAILQGLKDGSHVLIEATANQVNQDGGYINMTPDQFVDYVKSIATKLDFPCERIIFEGTI